MGVTFPALPPLTHHGCQLGRASGGTKDKEVASTTTGLPPARVHGCSCETPSTCQLMGFETETARGTCRVTGAFDGKGLLGLWRLARPLQNGTMQYLPARGCRGCACQSIFLGLVVRIPACQTDSACSQVAGVRFPEGEFFAPPDDFDRGDYKEKKAAKVGPRESNSESRAHTTQRDD